MTFKELCKSLETEIENSYTEGVTVDEAEKLAGKFLHAQISVSRELQKSDLDSRMRKQGVKTVRAAIYQAEIKGQDKKPTESALDHAINLNDVVQGEQEAFDKAETERDELERLYNIFANGHIYFRGIAKGKFE